jgi:hypothetical protein
MDALYNQVKLTMGDIHCNPTEGHWVLQANGTQQLVPGNDNDDPTVLDMTAFDWSRPDSSKTHLGNIARRMISTTSACPAA